MTDAPISSEASSEVLAAADLQVTHGKTTILRDVNVQVARGEVLGVLGPSGAGKSTLFRALVGDLSVTSGTIRLGGDDVTDLPLWARARRGIGYVPQTPSVLWDFSVADNLRTYLRILHGAWFWRAAPDEAAAIAELAERVALQERLDVRAGDLSGGERRRLELARALIRRPKVLVCDEPFAGVDPRQAGRLGDLLRDLSRQDVAVLLADHHVAEALRVCTRAILLIDGAVAVSATPEQFQAHPLVVGRYLGSWQRSIPPPSPG